MVPQSPGAGRVAVLGLLRDSGDFLPGTFFWNCQQYFQKSPDTPGSPEGNTEGPGTPEHSIG